jgi:hypothetical protein
MNKLTRIFFLAIMLFLTGAPAHAFSVDLDGTGTNAVGITDLDISGTAYDVTFELIQAGAAGIFFTSDPAAQAATNAINAALNSSPAVTIGSSTNLNYFVPYSAGGGNVEADQGSFIADTTWIRLGASLDDTDIVEMARFSPAVVPIPAAAWLFGSALGMLGWIRRRTGKKSLS